MSQKDKDSLKKGVLLALIAAIISGFAIFYSKFAVAKIPPLILTTSRNMTAAVLLMVSYFLLLRRRQELKNLKKEDAIKLVLIGIIGGALPFYLFFSGLQLVKAPIANLIHKTLFIWVTFLAVVFLKEKLNLGYIIAFILIFIGNFYFAKIPTSFGKGELLILIATLFWSVENILAKKVLKNVSSELVGLSRMGIGSLILVAALITTGQLGKLSAINSQQLTVILIGGTILFFYVYFWYKALKYAPASLATLILTFSVVVGNILTGAFAGVKILPKDLYSSFLIIIATIILYFVATHQPAYDLPGRKRSLATIRKSAKNG